MKRLTVACFLIFFILACSAPDRETFLKRKMIGTWTTKSFGAELKFIVTDSTFYSPKEGRAFYADRYHISKLDSISLCTPHDTIVLKLLLNKRADTMWLFNDQIRSEFVRVE